MRCEKPIQLFALLLCAGFLSATTQQSQAQEAESFRFQIGGGQVQSEGGDGIVIRLGEPSGYWIGIEIEPLDAEDRAGTDLPEGQGLEVEQVLPESPAASAGIQEDDILVSAGDQPLHNLDELQKLIQESEGKPLSIVLLRDGERKTVEVTPARREQGGVIVLTEEGEEREEGEEGAERRPRDHRLNPQSRPGSAFQWQPLHVVPGGPAPGNAGFPDDLNVTIRKRGNAPVRIRVTQGVQSWTIGPDELDKLPEPIRGHVAGLLPHPTPAAAMMPRPRQAQFVIRQQPQPAADLVPGASAAGASPPVTQRQLQQLKAQLHELQEQVEALRANQ